MTVQGNIVRSTRESGVACHEVFYEGRMTLPQHAHESAFIAWSMDGRFRESACGSEIHCAPRSIVFHPAREEHTVVMESPIVRCLAIEFDPFEISRRFDASTPASLRHLDGGPLSDVFANLYGEMRHGDASSSLAIQGLVLQLLAGLSRTESREERSRPRWLGRVEEMLRSDLRSRLTLEDIAAAVGQTPARVSAAFRRFYNRSIAEEQRRLRVDFARERLRDPEVPLAEIAIEAGFSDQAHFCRAFKQVTGTTPSQFRLVTCDACEESS